MTEFHIFNKDSLVLLLNHVDNLEDLFFNTRPPFIVKKNDSET